MLLSLQRPILLKIQHQFVVMLLACQALYSQDLTVIFEKGNAAYNDGNFEAAISQYEAILEAGHHSAALYFNLGNAYYRLNNIAESIFYFEKAKQLDPKNEDILLNSSFANNMTIDAIEALPKSQLAVFEDMVFQFFGVHSWAILLVLLSWLVFFLFLGYLFNHSPEVKRRFFAASVLLFVVLLAGFSFVYVNDKQTQNTEYAILFSKQINIRTEPNDRADVEFVLHEGTKVVLLDRLDEWQKIRIANGSMGWTKNAELRLLNQAYTEK